MSTKIDIYIRRVEKNHTEEEITRILRNEKIGVVDNVKFIEKLNYKTKQMYFGAIVTMKEWYTTEKNAKKMMAHLEKMQDASDEPYQFYFGNRRPQAYWYMQRHITQQPAASKFTQFKEAQKVALNTELAKDDKMAKLMEIIKKQEAMLEKMGDDYMEHERQMTRATMFVRDARYEIIELEHENIELLKEMKRMKGMDVSEDVIVIATKALPAIIEQSDEEEDYSDEEGIVIHC